MRPFRAAIALNLLLAMFTGAASAHGGSDTQVVVSPGTVNAPGVANPGAFACQGINPSVAAFCGANAFGGAIFNVSGVDAPLAQHYHSHANGWCDVSPGTLQLLGAKYFYICATDRNDDGLVMDGDVSCILEDDTVAHAPWGISNHDECTGQTTGSPNEDHPDDWVDGCWSPSATADCPSPTRGVPFCFQDDVTGFTAPATDDTGLPLQDVSLRNQAGGSFDDVFVFVGVTMDGTVTANHVGDLWITLAMAGAAACNLGAVSAHTTAGNTRTTTTGGWGGWGGWGNGPRCPNVCGGGDP